MTSLADISAASTKGAFPLNVLDECQTALCLFGAGFLGRNDVIHVWNAGIETATVVDVDVAKLDEMRRLYTRDEWQFVPRDCYAFAETWREEKRLADLVTVDPWTQQVGKALAALPLWCSIARKAVVIGASAEWFAEQGIEPTLFDVQKWLAARYREFAEPPVLWSLTKRSGHRGGTWWIALDPRPTWEP